MTIRFVNPNALQVSQSTASPTDGWQNGQHGYIADLFEGCSDWYLLSSLLKLCQKHRK